MKIVVPLAAALMFSACGGGEPAKTGPAKSSTGTPSASQQAAPKAAPKKTKKKRAKRVKLNMPMVKALLATKPATPPAPVESTPALVALGDSLYHTELLSAEGNLSCASCHDLSTYGVDNKKVSPGSKGMDGDRNTPTTYNAFMQFRQFWDGRSASVEEQAIEPVINPVEHGIADKAAVVAKIKEDSDLVAAFAKAFPGQDDPVTADNFGAAVGAFERTLVTPTRWEKFLDGDRKALTNEEQQGLKTFMDLNCTQCHMTRMLGGNMYQKLGVYKPWTGEDTGRMKVTGNEAEKYMFKVPGLLNVEKTAPYYHDGSIATLEEAVKDMAVRQLNKQITDEQTAQIVTFLKALTGEVPEKYRKK